MALPFLPGNSFNPNLGKVQYHKSHHFDYSNDISMMMSDKPGVGGEFLPGQSRKPNNSAIPRGAGSSLPAWVAFDRQVLCFDAYFQEAVHEKREEQYRIRQCKIYFYLEDDSIQVIEPRLKNSGIPQGTLIRRHRIPKPPPNDDQFYTVEDFNVGKELLLYSRSFKLTSSDQFTQNFLSKLGVRIDNPNGHPEDPYMNHRKAMDDSMQPLRPYEKHDILKQFLDHDHHVLRFYCYWDDTDNMFGDPREMVLHYFLADDTIEIREIISSNSGRDATPMFLRRERLPKDIIPLLQPGEQTDRTVLNVFGPTGHGGRYILDSLKTGAVHTEYYTDSDLTVGTVLNVWGRRFVLCDCDEYTKEYYKTKYGVEFTSIPFKKSSQPCPPREMPPYNGFGSEEDSLCSCMGLLPKPPKRDFIKFMEKDRHGLDSNVIRFLARMDTSKPIDADRRFIISYFLSDDSILVFEPPVRNSGIIGGKFLERGRVKKPDQQLYSTKLSEYYNAHDLYVGTRVEFNNHRFVLIDADEYAYNYMEKHCHEFQRSNVGLIMQKLASAVSNIDDITRQDTSGASGILPFEQFRSAVQSLAVGHLTDHEIISVARSYQDRKDDGYNLKTLVALSQEQLRKVNYEDFSTIAAQCDHYDEERIGFLSRKSLRTVSQSLKIPLPDDLLRALISAMPANESGEVSITDFVHNLNWRDHPVAPLPQQDNLDTDWQGTPKNRQINNVNYAEFITDLTAASKGIPK